MTDPLSKLPLFATDEEIAIAIVGKQRASQWRRSALIVLEARGFPKIDAIHGGRPTALIRKFYELYLGLNKNYIQAAPDSAPDQPETWTRRKKDDRKPQLGLDGRMQSVLIYMVSHPDAQTHPAIPNAGAATVDRLAAKGAVSPTG